MEKQNKGVRLDHISKIYPDPKTGKEFKMSNHGSEEVATGTLKAIKRAAGI